MDYEFTEGEGRVQVNLRSCKMGKDIVVRIFNQGAHVGAVAIGEYDEEHQRASTSVITLLGHKDDAVAQKAAYLVSKAAKTTVCVVAGIHIDDISGNEISEILNNAMKLVERLIDKIA
jgi:gallate decarboxylase subunit D